jgi:5-methylcytosine-specific restriction endonuclease McrA
MILAAGGRWCNGAGGPIVVCMPSPERKEAVFQRHDFTCVYCGRRFSADELTVDHVEPRVKGGDHSRGNLVAACRPCNREKGGQPAWAFLADRPEQRANFLRLARFVWPRLRTAVEDAAD